MKLAVPEEFRGDLVPLMASLEGLEVIPDTRARIVVDEKTGLVKRADGSTIRGLYAAGRTAVGIASNSYVSGLSIADCVFSGRRAGRHAASVSK